MAYRDVSEVLREENAKLIEVNKQLVELLEVSQISIGGEWRKRRDDLIIKAKDLLP